MCWGITMLRLGLNATANEDLHIPHGLEAHAEAPSAPFPFSEIQRGGPL